jgi:hypothetical protein
VTFKASLPLHHGPEVSSRSSINVARAQDLGVSETVQSDSMNVVEQPDQLLQLASGDARWLEGAVGDQDVANGICHLLCHLLVVKAPLVRASCDLTSVHTTLRHAALQAVEDYVHVVSASGSSIGSRPVDRAFAQSEPQHRVVEVVAVVVDTNMKLCGVADNAMVVGSDMTGRLNSNDVVDQVEVEGVLTDVNREEFGAKIRYIRKAGELGECVYASVAAAITHVLIDSVAQLGWEITEAKRCRHCGNGSSCGCSKTVGSGGSQCSDGSESFGTS